MAWIEFDMMITIPLWNGGDWGFPEHGVFVLYDPADEFEGLVAVVFLGGDQGLVQDHADKFGCRGALEFIDEVTRGGHSFLTLVFGADVSRLQCEVDSPGGTVHLFRRHDLLAKQEPRFRGQFDTRSCSETDWRTVYDHDFALAQLQNEIRH